MDETLSQDEKLQELIDALTEISKRDWAKNPLDPQSWPASRVREAIAIYQSTTTNKQRRTNA